MSDTNSHGIPEPEGKADVINTDYEIGQDNIERQIGPFGLDIHNPVFLISGIAVVIFVFYTIALPEQAAAVFFGRTELAYARAAFEVAAQDPADCALADPALV